MSAKSDAVLRALKQFGLQLPGAHGKAPWPGHDDLAVNDKTFAYLSVEGEPFKVSCKLPYTGDEALDLPFAAPATYGLGRSGWVTFTPDDAQMPPVARFQAWIEESYRAQALRRFVKLLDARQERGD
jgi:predicted DNA-binding protein (MmcQ/YjbR family)